MDYPFNENLPDILSRPGLIIIPLKEWMNDPEEAVRKYIPVGAVINPVRSGKVTSMHEKKELAVVYYCYHRRFEHDIENQDNMPEYERIQKTDRTWRSEHGYWYQNTKEKEKRDGKKAG